MEEGILPGGGCADFGYWEAFIKTLFCYIEIEGK